MTNSADVQQMLTATHEARESLEAGVCHAGMLETMYTEVGEHIGHILQVIDEAATEPLMDAARMSGTTAFLAEKQSLAAQNMLGEALNGTTNLDATTALAATTEVATHLGTHVRDMLHIGQDVQIAVKKLTEAREEFLSVQARLGAMVAELQKVTGNGAVSDNGGLATPSPEGAASLGPAALEALTRYENGLTG